MAEIDLALTKDSVLILMHDKTIDRTTTGKGKPSDYTLEEIRQFYLRDGAGHATQMRVPVLEEALLESKGKIFLNLDKDFRVWVNSLWHDQNAGNHDDVSLDKPDVYDWYVERHAWISLLQTPQAQLAAWWASQVISERLCRTL